MYIIIVIYLIFTLYTFYHFYLCVSKTFRTVSISCISLWLALDMQFINWRKIYRIINRFDFLLAALQSAAYADI